MRVTPAIVVMLYVAAAVLLSACGSHVWHPVRKGDTLYSISFRYGQDYKQVAKWNDIPPPYIISLGQNIRISPPPPAAYKPALTAVKKQPSPVSPRPSTATQSPVITSTASQKTPSPPLARPANTIVVVTKPPPPQYSQTVTWHWPVKGKLIQTFSDQQPGRKGIDIAAARGAVIKAAASGRVVYAGEGLASYGKLIIIKHNEQFLSAYAHNQTMRVKEGQHIQAGTAIAEMGDSGTNRVKLHFEVRRKGKPVNPLRYLPQR